MRDNYSLWERLQEKNPDRLDLAKKIERCIEYGLLAPSTHNSQPWAIEIHGNVCDLRLDNNSYLPEADPLGRDLLISLGCFVENCTIASRALHINMALEEEFEGALDKVRIRMLFSDSTVDQLQIERELFDAIPKRVNARGIFDSRKSIPKEIKEEIDRLNTESHIKIMITENKEEKKYIAEKTGQAVVIAQSNKNFRKEFGKLVKNNLTKSKIGIPGFSIGLSLVPSFFAPYIFRNVDISKILGIINRKAMLASSAIIVLLSKENNLRGWYLCGRIFERSNLFLVSRNIKSSIHVAAAELEPFAQDLMIHFGWTWRPQMIFRVGFSEKKFHHTPRKNLADFTLGKH